MSPPGVRPRRAPERKASERAADASPPAGGAFCVWSGANAGTFAGFAFRFAEKFCQEPAHGRLAQR
jgi:hypothetical protein